MKNCKRCGARMNAEPWHDTIEWCGGCWNRVNRGPPTQELSQEFVRDSLPPRNPEFCELTKVYYSQGIVIATAGRPFKKKRIITGPDQF